MRPFYVIALSLLMIFLIGCEETSDEPPGKERVIQELNGMTPFRKKIKRREHTIREDKKIPETINSSENEESGYVIPHGLFVVIKYTLYIIFCIIILGIIYLIFFSSGHVRFPEAKINSSIRGKKNSESALGEDEQMTDPIILGFESLLSKGHVTKAVLILYKGSIQRFIKKGFFLKKDQLTNNEIKSLLKEDENLRDFFSQLVNEVERSIFGHKKIDRADCLKLFQRYKEVF